MVNLYPGQKVVCVDATFSVGTNTHGLKEGQIYTIRDVGPIPLWQQHIDHLPDRVIGVRLMEIERSFTWMLDEDKVDEAMYRATRFKPLIKTDISSLIALLDTVPADLELV